MSVLVALDEGSIAEEVLAAITPYLVRTGTEAHLVTVMDPGDIHGTRSSVLYDPWATGDLTGGLLPIGSHQQATVVESRTQAFSRTHKARAEYLEELGGRHLPREQFHVHVEASSDVADSIVRLARKFGADAIAIGTHARRGMRRVILGSIAEEVIRKSDVPVFVVREGMGGAGDSKAASA